MKKPNDLTQSCRKFSLQTLRSGEIARTWRHHRRDPRQGRRLARSPVGGREASREVRELVRVSVLNAEPSDARVGRVQIRLVAVVVAVFLVASRRRLFDREAAYATSVAVVTVAAVFVDGTDVAVLIDADVVASADIAAVVAVNLALHVLEEFLLHFLPFLQKSKSLNVLLIYKLFKRSFQLKSLPIF